MSDYLHKQVLTPGQKFGKYDVVKLVGKGGMGEVYLANDPFLDRDVAIKVLPLKRTADALYRERMQREAAAGARAQHVNLVRMYDGGVTADDVVFLVMEYLGEHKTLRELIFASAPFGYAQWLHIGVQIADGLMACHAASIVHRDLKPENVLVLAGAHIKIIDFGLAKIRSSALRTTVGDKRLATPLYASPEQLGGPSKELTEKTDLWAFGCVLYEMAVGRQIWQTTTGVLPSPQQATWAMQSREPPKLSASGLKIPKALADLVDQCLERDPTRRPSAMDLSRGLRQFLSAQPATASTDLLSSGFRSPEPGPARPVGDAPAAAEQASPALPNRGPASSASPESREPATDLDTAVTEEVPETAFPKGVPPDRVEPVPAAEIAPMPGASSPQADTFDPDGTRFGDERRAEGVALEAPSVPTTERDAVPRGAQAAIDEEVQAPKLVASPVPAAEKPARRAEVGPRRVPNTSLEPRNVGVAPALPPPEQLRPQAASPLPAPVLPAAAFQPAQPKPAPETMQSGVPLLPGEFRAVPRTIQMNTVDPAARPLGASAATSPRGSQDRPSTPAHGGPVAPTEPLDASGSLSVGGTQRRPISDVVSYILVGVVMAFLVVVFAVYRFTQLGGDHVGSYSRFPPIPSDTEVALPSAGTVESAPPKAWDPPAESLTSAVVPALSIAAPPSTPSTKPMIGPHPKAPQRPAKSWDDMPTK